MESERVFFVAHMIYKTKFSNFYARKNKYNLGFTEYVGISFIYLVKL